MPTVRTEKDIVEALIRLGWRVRSDGELDQVIRLFQEGWHLGELLVVDGIAGPRTRAAMEISLERLAEGKGTCSPHFSFSEFACKCGGRYNTCLRQWPQIELIRSLERLRSKYYPQGLQIRSGSRCGEHNEAVGGATFSQHLIGAAADIVPAVSWKRLMNDEMFSGLGFMASTGLVAHVDRRDSSGHNGTGGSLSRPTVWKYGS